MFVEKVKLELVNDWLPLIDPKKMPKDILDIFTDDRIAENLTDGIFQIERKNFKKLKKKVIETVVVRIDETDPEVFEDECYLLTQIRLKNWYDMRRTSLNEKSWKQVVCAYIELQNFEEQKLEINVNELKEVVTTKTHIFFKAKYNERKEPFKKRNYFVESFEIQTKIKSEIFKWLPILIKITLEAYQELKYDDFMKKEALKQTVSDLTKWDKTAFQIIVNRIMRMPIKTERNVIYNQNFGSDKFILKQDEHVLKKFEICTFICGITKKNESLKRKMLAKIGSKKSKLLLTLV